MKSASTQKRKTLNFSQVIIAIETQIKNFAASLTDKEYPGDYETPRI